MKPSINVTLTVDIGDGGKPSLLVILPGTDGDKFNIPLDESPAIRPRPFDRGKHKRLARVVAGGHQLQFGHGLSTVENS